ncbi:MAG TPA: SAM-dependent methyltransferase [Actinophytocola sp.]|nr:SAM-dependent methyltransferase [Actinophytocola sp.]
MSEVQADPVPPVGVDLNRPSVARVYDYYLGGTANWAIDREFADRVLDRFPLLRDIAIANRMFLNRAVRHLTKLGVRQFLDIGAGVPTAGNTHQVADEVVAEEGHDSDVRVVYVDNEPVAVAHAELLLDQQGDPARHAVIDADLRDPQELWRKALDTELLDPTQPIALLLIAVLHIHQPGPDGQDVGPRSVAELRELLPAGSYMAISHLTDEGVPPELDDKLVGVKKMYDSSSASNVIWRSRAEIGTLLGDFRLVEPGWTWTPEWHPEETGPTVREIRFPTPGHAAIWSGVGQKMG